MSLSPASLTEPRGLVLILVNVFLNQLGLPVPVEPTLVFAGAAIANRPVAGLLLALMAAACCLLADLLWYSWAGVMEAVSYRRCVGYPLRRTSALVKRRRVLSAGVRMHCCLKICSRPVVISSATGRGTADAPDDFPAIRCNR